MMITMLNKMFFKIEGFELLNVVIYLIDQQFIPHMFGTKRIWFDSQRSSKKVKETSSQQILNGLMQLLSQNIQNGSFPEKGNQFTSSSIGESDQKGKLISNRDFCEYKERSTKGHQSLLDPRDQELVYPFAFHLDFFGLKEEIEGGIDKQVGQIIQASKLYVEFLAEIQTYLSEIVQSITSISFNLLNQDRLTDNEAKAFASKNIFQNIQQICLETRKAAQNILEATKIQKIMLAITQDIDTYLLTLFGQLASHYPQASGGGQTARMREVILNVNRSADETNDLIFTKDLKIQKYVPKKEQTKKKEDQENNEQVQNDNEQLVKDNLQEKGDESNDQNQDLDKQDVVIQGENNVLERNEVYPQEFQNQNPQEIDDGIGETDEILQSDKPLQYLRYSGFIMEVINASISVTRDSYSEREQISIFEKFHEFNEKMFVINQHEPYRLAINKAAKQGEVNNENSALQNIFSYFQKILIPQSELTEDQKRDAEEPTTQKGSVPRIRSAKQQRKNDKYQTDKQLNFSSEALQKELMNKLQDLKKFHKYAISQKIPNSVRPFGENEIKASSFQINNSTILRIMTKWAQNLQDIFKRPQFHTIQRLQRFKDIKNETIYLTTSSRETLCYKIKTQSKFVQQQLKKLKQSNVVFQSYLLSQASDNISTFLKRFTSIRETCSKMNAMLTEFTHKYLCILIYHLLEAGEGIDDHGWNKQHINMVSFKVGDLLRSKFECTESSFISIVNTLNLLDDAKELKGKFKLVRVKNKLNQKDNNVLVNYLLFNKVQCELQISIQNMKGKEKNYYNYCHFLYELTRGKFGVLTEFAIIVSQHDSVINSSNDKYYRPKRIDYQAYKKTKPKNPQNIVFKKQEDLYICLGCKQLKIRQNIGLFSKADFCNDCTIVQQKEKKIAQQSTDEEKTQAKLDQKISKNNCIQEKIEIQKLKQYLLDGLYNTNKIKRILSYKQIKNNQFLIVISNYGRNSNQLKLYRSFYHRRELKTFLVELNTTVLTNFDSDQFDYSKLDYFDITQKRRLNEPIPQLFYSIDRQQLYKIVQVPVQQPKVVPQQIKSQQQSQQKPTDQPQPIQQVKDPSKQDGKEVQNIQKPPQKPAQQPKKKIQTLCSLLGIDRKLVEKIKFFMKAFKQFRVEKEIVKSLKFKTENIDLSSDQLKLKTLYKIDDNILGKKDETLKYRKFKIKQWRSMNKIQLTGNNIKSTDHLPSIVSKASELNLSSNIFQKFKTPLFQQNIEILSFYWNQNYIRQVIDFSKCHKLTYLYAYTSKIIGIRLRNLVNLKYLDLSYNSLKKIDLSTNINLQHVDLTRNQIPKIKMMNHHQLMYLNVSENGCEKISIKYNHKLVPEKCILEKNKQRCSVVIYADSIEQNEKFKQSATKFIEKLFEMRKIKAKYTYQLKSDNKEILILKNPVKKEQPPPNIQAPIQEQPPQV